MSKPRLAIVISHPIQHFAPLYAYIAHTEDVELKVFFLAENGLVAYHDQEFGEQVQWDVPLTKGYQSEFVEPGRILDNFSFSSVDSPRLVERVTEFRPDVVWLHGYAQRANWRVLFARPCNARLIYSSDSNLADKRSWLREFAKTSVIRWFFKRIDYFLSISPSNRAYLEHYGAQPASIIDTTFPIDVARFERQKKQLSDDDRVTMRATLNIPESATVILFVGKLIAHKRPQDVIEALRNANLSEAYAVIVGSGAMLEELKLLAKTYGVESRCCFVGFVNQSDMARYFNAADLFVFPSEREPYGAIAAETLPFGLPLIVAENIGAVGVSAIENENAILYPVSDVDALADGIYSLMTDASLSLRFCEASMALANMHDKSKMAHDIIQLCKRAA